MEITQINYVLMIAHYNSFSKAAEQLFVTQPTLSQQIKYLEEELGFSLFNRTTRAVSLTEEGKIFVELAKPVVENYEILADKMNLLKKNTLPQNLSIGILPTFSHLNISNLFASFQETYYDINISFKLYSSNQLIEMLINDKLDVIMANIFPIQKRNLEQDIEISIISEDHINVIVNKSNPLSNKSEISLNDIKNESIIMLDKKSSIYRQLDQVLKTSDITPRKTLFCPEIHSMIGMVQSNMGIGFLSSKVASDLIHSPIVSIPFSPTLTTMTCIMYKKNSSLRNGIHLFVEHTKALLKDEH